MWPFSDVLFILASSSGFMLLLDAYLSFRLIPLSDYLHFCP